MQKQNKKQFNLSHWETWKLQAPSINARCELLSDCKGVYRRQRNIVFVFGI